MAFYSTSNSIRLYWRHGRSASNSRLWQRGVPERAVRAGGSDFTVSYSRRARSSPQPVAEIHDIMSEYPLAGDFALWCEMYRYAELTGCRYPLCGFRCRPDQRSLHMDQYLSEARTALDRLRADLGWNGPGLRENLAKSLPSGKARRLMGSSKMNAGKVYNKDYRAKRE